MATGLLASMAAQAATDLLVYQVPAGFNAVVTCHVQNTDGANPVTMSMAVTQGGVPGANSWIEKGVSLDVGQGLERSGIVLSAGQRLYVNGSSVNIALNVWGIEEAA